MHFDVTTALAVNALLTLGVGLSLAFATLRYPVELRRPMHVWIGGLFLQAVALLTPGWLGHAPSGPIVVAANLVYVLAYAEMGRAMRGFMGQRGSGWPLFLILVVGVISVLFGMIWPDTGTRIALNSVPIALLQVAVARPLASGGRPQRPAERLTRTLFNACAILALIRGVSAALGPEHVPLDLYDGLNSIVFLSNSLLPALGTIAFVLMCGDRLSDDLSRLAMVDPLTGVYDRRTLAGFAASAIAEVNRVHLPLALLAIDVDHFKQINDGFGHDIGDAALIGLVARMREALDPGHVLSRIGGEEFAVLLPGMNEDEASVVAERLREHIGDAPFFLDGNVLSLNVSIGIATLADGPRTLHDLLREADRALYAAKKSGRNRCVLRSSMARSPRHYRIAESIR